MKKSLYLVGISGSLRKISSNVPILNNLPDLLPPDTSPEIIWFADLPLCDADPAISASKERAEKSTVYGNQLGAADRWVIATPKYNNAISGRLKKVIKAIFKGRRFPIDRLSSINKGKEILVVNEKNKFDKKANLTGKKNKRWKI